MKRVQLNTAEQTLILDALTNLMLNPKDKRKRPAYILYQRLGKLFLGGK